MFLACIFKTEITVFAIVDEFFFAIVDKNCCFLLRLPARVVLEAVSMSHFCDCSRVVFAVQTTTAGSLATDLHISLDI